MRHGWNLSADRSRIEATAEARDWPLVRVYDDGGSQGDDPDRPGFLTMLDDAEAGEFDVIIMRDLDRLGRKTTLTALAFDTFERHNVAVHEFYGHDGTDTRRLDLDNEDDRALAEIKAVFAQLEKAKIKRRVRQAKAARARSGGHPGGRRPFGYRQRDLTHDGRQTGPLLADPIEAAVVVCMFELADGGTSQRKIAQILNADGVKTSRGGPWRPSPVARVLGSPLYVGKIRRKVAGEWELHDGEHAAIVDVDLWDRVNRSRATPQRRAGGRPLTSSHLLTRGMLRCGSCGLAMIPYALRDRAEVYRCIGRHQHGPGFCSRGSIRRDVVDEALLAQLTGRYVDIDGAPDRLRARQASELPLAKAAVADAERELATAEARIQRVDRGWHDGVISDEKYRRQSAQLEEELAGAQKAVTQAQARVDQIESAGASTDAKEALLAHLADLKQLVGGTVGRARDVEALRTVIRQLFASVELCPPPTRSATMPRVS